MRSFAIIWLWGVVLALMNAAWAAQAPLLTFPVPSPGSHTSQVLWLKVQDLKGSYTLPHIQTARDLRIKLEFTADGLQRARVRLQRGEELIAEQRLSPGHPRTHFCDLAPGEYSLQVQGLSQRGEALAEATWERIGIGTVIAALGDSLTEGYHGVGFWRDNLDLTAAQFPPEAVSHDGRNFPQYSPTTAWHKPEVNCFQSWMTALNDLLTASWRQPVYIANEGYGGITTGRYLQMMQEDKGWQKRMKLLRPTVWLIHLGVNDERAKLPADEVARNMEAIVRLLISDYGAAPERIFIARPSYDYFPRALEILKSYIVEYDKLIPALSVQHGPDFFAAYSVDKAKWYGEDPVHPNEPGMVYMARMWSDVLVRALPHGSAP